MIIVLLTQMQKTLHIALLVREVSLLYLKIHFIQGLLAISGPYDMFCEFAVISIICLVPISDIFFSFFFFHVDTIKV